MIMTPSSFSYEVLSNLKFKDLQKLSAQFHVNKRWAKKQELIENLLALKEKNETTIDNKQEDKTEWRDGSTVFSGPNVSNESEMRRRTFNIEDNYSRKNIDSDLTSVVSDNDNLCKQTFSCRETYDVAPQRIDLDAEPLSDPRATFDIPLNEKLIGDLDSRATFEVCQNKTKLLEENEIRSKNFKCEDKLDMKLKKNIIFKQNLGSMKFGLKLQNKTAEQCETAGSQVKTLSIPCARLTKRNEINEASKNNSSLIKLSNKSVNIKKSTRIVVNKCDFIKSPVFSIKKSVKKNTVLESLTEKESTEIIQTDVPTGIQCSEEKPNHIETVNISDKENSKTVLKTKILTTANDEYNSSTNCDKANFRTSEARKIASLRKTFLKDVGAGKLNFSAAQIPGNKLTIKPMATIKMPDFNKIHKKQFEQMDSLPDYLIKKEQRIKKLFGTPQPGQLQTSSKSGRVFHFHSSLLGKENKGSTASKIATVQQKKECDSKITQKEAFKCKLPPLKLRANIKDKNRSHIQGVRTNKRFELQMQFRKI